MLFSEFLALTEAIIDHQYPLKAVFMAGGPGSGKTFVAEHMFANLGFKFSNSDQILRTIANHTGQSDVPDATADNDKYHLKFQMNLKAINLSQKRSTIWMSNGIPYVIDITGRNTDLIQNLDKKLNRNGYDTYMVFVRTNLETAIQRNRNRANTGLHVADEEYLITAWHDSVKNLDYYKDLFQDHLLVVENNDDVDVPRLHRMAIKLLGEPKYVINPIGKKYIADYVRYSYRRDAASV